jgi:hypothetical protein
MKCIMKTLMFFSNNVQKIAIALIFFLQILLLEKN